MFLKCVCDSEGGSIHFSSDNLCFKMIFATTFSRDPSQEHVNTI